MHPLLPILIQALLPLKMYGMNGNNPSPIFFLFQAIQGTCIKESMIKPIRVKAGLGNPPIEYHNNCPECMNNVIKMKVDRK